MAHPPHPALRWRGLRHAFRPAPGSHAAAPAWWGREHWLEIELACALACRPEICREEHVAPDTLKRVAAAHAAYADHATGRDCRPTNERIAADVGFSVRQVQRARRVLRRLDLLVEIVRGRSIMTRAERLAAWRSGSRARRIAAEFALVSLRCHPQGCRCVVERVTPPAPVGVRGSPYLVRGSSTATNRRKSAPPGLTDKSRRPRTVSPATRRTQKLIAGLQRRVPWLRGVPARRLMALHRFAAQHWTERDVLAATDQVLAARGWRVPDKVTNPAAYLAMLLREVDEHDRPSAYDEQLRDERLVVDEWRRANIDRECRHEWPLGDLPHPISGKLGCPMCRRENQP